MSNSRQGGGYEGKRGHGKGFKRCPVKLGEELEVAITELSPKGRYR
jgi:predicted RNA-binding protein with TRAM domain